MKNLLIISLVLTPVLSFAQANEILKKADAKLVQALAPTPRNAPVTVEPYDFVNLIEKDKRILLKYYNKFKNLIRVTDEEHAEVEKLETKYRVNPETFRKAKSMEMFFKIHPKVQDPSFAGCSISPDQQEIVCPTGNYKRDGSTNNLEHRLNTKADLSQDLSSGDASKRTKSKSE